MSESPSDHTNRNSKNEIFYLKFTFVEFCSASSFSFPWDGFLLGLLVCWKRDLRLFWRSKTVKGDFSWSFSGLMQCSVVVHKRNAVFLSRRNLTYSYAKNNKHFYLGECQKPLGHRFVGNAWMVQFLTAFQGELQPILFGREWVLIIRVMCWKIHLAPYL